MVRINFFFFFLGIIPLKLLLIGKPACNDEILSLTIWWDVNLLWKFADVHLKPVLNIVQSAGVSLIWHKGDGQTFRSKPASPCNLKEWAKWKLFRWIRLHPITWLCLTNHYHMNWTDPVQVCVWIFRHVVVEGDVDSFDVHTSAKQVCGHQDPSLEILELLISS